MLGDGSQFGIQPSDRGELEITSFNQHYLNNDSLLHIQIMSRCFAWLFTGTHEAYEATEFVKAVEKRTGLKIACLEEIVCRLDWIFKEEVAKQISGLKGHYFEYLSKINL